jgi:hypothetical protein
MKYATQLPINIMPPIRNTVLLSLLFAIFPQVPALAIWEHAATKTLWSEGGHVKSLRGLRVLWVIVHDAPVDYGISEKEVERAFEDRLQTIGVLTGEAALLSPYWRDVSNMAVSVHIYPSDTPGRFHFSISLSLDQGVALVRDPAIRFPVATWSLNTLDIFHPRHARNIPQIRAAMTAAMDKFVSDWKEANNGAGSSRKNESRGSQQPHNSPAPTPQ